MDRRRRRKAAPFSPAELHGAQQTPDHVEQAQETQDRGPRRTLAERAHKSLASRPGEPASLGSLGSPERALARWVPGTDAGQRPGTGWAHRSSQPSGGVADECGLLVSLVNGPRPRSPAGALAPWEPELAAGGRAGGGRPTDPVAFVVDWQRETDDWLDRLTGSTGAGRNKWLCRPTVASSPPREPDEHNSTFISLAVPSLPCSQRNHAPPSPSHPPSVQTRPGPPCAACSHRNTPRQHACDRLSVSAVRASRSNSSPSRALSVLAQPSGRIQAAGGKTGRNHRHWAIPSARLCCRRPSLAGPELERGRSRGRKLASLQ